MLSNFLRAWRNDLPSHFPIIKEPHKLCSIGEASSGDLWERTQPLRDSVFTLFEALTSDGRSCSVFAVRRGTNGILDSIQVAEEALALLRMVRHPDWIKYIDSASVPSGIYIATEVVDPLRCSVRDFDPFGLYSITKAMTFFHEALNRVHGALSASSMFVSRESGAWKLSAPQTVATGSLQRHDREAMVQWICLFTNESGGSTNSFNPKLQITNSRLHDDVKLALLDFISYLKSDSLLSLALQSSSLRFLPSVEVLVTFQELPLSTNIQSGLFLSALPTKTQNLPLATRKQILCHIWQMQAAILKLELHGVVVDAILSIAQPLISSEPEAFSSLVIDRILLPWVQGADRVLTLIILSQMARILDCLLPSQAAKMLHESLSAAKRNQGDARDVALDALSLLSTVVDEESQRLVMETLVTAAIKGPLAERVRAFGALRRYVSEYPNGGGSLMSCALAGMQTPQTLELAVGLLGQVLPCLPAKTILTKVLPHICGVIDSMAHLEEGEIPGPRFSLLWPLLERAIVMSRKSYIGEFDFSGMSRQALPPIPPHPACRPIVDYTKSQAMDAVMERRIPPPQAEVPSSSVEQHVAKQASCVPLPVTMPMKPLTANFAEIKCNLGVNALEPAKSSPQISEVKVVCQGTGSIPQRDVKSTPLGLWEEPKVVKEEEDIWDDWSD